MNCSTIFPKGEIRSLYCHSNIDLTNICNGIIDSIIKHLKIDFLKDIIEKIRDELCNKFIKQCQEDICEGVNPPETNRDACYYFKIVLSLFLQFPPTRNIIKNKVSRHRFISPISPSDLDTMNLSEIMNKICPVIFYFLGPTRENVNKNIASIIRGQSLLKFITAEQVKPFTDCFCDPDKDFINNYHPFKDTY